MGSERNTGVVTLCPVSLGVSRKVAEQLMLEEGVAPQCAPRIKGMEGVEEDQPIPDVLPRDVTPPRESERDKKRNKICGFT